MTQLRRFVDRLTGKAALRAEVKLLRRRSFLLRDTLRQVAWRQAMDLRSVDQKAANRLIHMRLDADTAEFGQ